MVQLVVDYVKQETLNPLKGRARGLAFGVVGSVALGFGLVLLLIASLRVLQTETGEFHGNLSWVPYLIVAVMAIFIIGLGALRVTRGPGARRRPSGSDTQDR